MSNKLIKMYSLVAKMESIVASIKGMEALNMQRSSCGQAMGYDEGCFDDARIELDKISEELTNLSMCGEEAKK